MAMDGAKRRTALGNGRIPGQVIGGGVVPAGDWRSRLQKNSRQRIVNEMMETLKRNLPFAGQQGLQELKKIVVRFEGKNYTEATSQSDYLRKISLKMMTMEIKSQNLPQNLLQSNAASNSKNHKDPASLDSSSQIGSATDEDWQEKTYQKIKALREMYYVELNKFYERVADKVQQHDTPPQQPRTEPLEKLRFLKLMLERVLMFLRTNKNEIQPNHKDKIGGVEKQIVNILNSNRPRKAISSMQQGQLPQPHMPATQQPQVSNEGQLIPQMQQMNILGSSLPTQQNNSTSLHIEQQLQGQQQQQQQQQTSQLQPSQLHAQQQHFE